MLNYFSTFIIFLYLFSQENIEKALMMYESGNFQKAIEILEEVLDEDETNENALFYMGKSYYALKDFDEASDYFEELYDMNTKNPDHYKYLMKCYRILIDEVNIFRKMSMGKMMINTIRKISNLEPDSIKYQISLASALIEAPGVVGGDEDEALKIIAKIKEKSPADAEIIMFGYHLKNGEEEKAEAALATIEADKAKQKKHYYLYNRFGYYLLSNDKIQKAIKIFQTQVDLAPDKANPYDSLGDAYKAAEDYENARLSYKKALELDPEFESSRKNLEKIEDK